jgi:hypothetical protein
MNDTLANEFEEIGWVIEDTDRCPSPKYIAGRYQLLGFFMFIEFAARKKITMNDSEEAPDKRSADGSIVEKPSNSGIGVQVENGA